jgi:hypothetical protein
MRGEPSYESEEQCQDSSRHPLWHKRETNSLIAFCADARGPRATSGQGRVPNATFAATRASSPPNRSRSFVNAPVPTSSAPGEGLANDATALILYRFAVAAVEHDNEPARNAQPANDSERRNHVGGRHNGAEQNEAIVAGGIAEAAGQIAPWCPRSQDPEDAIENTTVIHPWHLLVAMHPKADLLCSL